MKKFLKTINALVITGLIASSALIPGTGFAIGQSYSDLNNDCKIINQLEPTPTPIATVEQEKPMTFWISNAEGKVGDTVTVNLNVSNVSKKGFSTGLLDVYFAQRNFEFISCEAGPLINDPIENFSYDYTSQRLRILYSDSKTPASFIKSDGVLCKLTFKIKNTGNMDIAVTSENRFYDSKITPLPKPNFCAGSIKIIGAPTLTSTPIPTPTAAQEKPMTLWVSGASGKVGDIVTVDVNLSNVSQRGFSSGLFDVYYPQKNLELVSCVGGPLVNDPVKEFYYNALSDKLRIMYSCNTYPDNCIKKDGVLCKLTFKVKNTGNMEIAVTSDSKFYDGTLVALPKPNFYGGAMVITGTTTSTPTPTPTKVVKVKPMVIGLSSAEGKVGDVVTVDVRLTDVPANGFASGIFDISFDKSKLELLSIKAGPIVSDNKNDISSSASKDGLRIMYSNSKGFPSDCIMSNGTLCKLTFKIKAKGTSKLEVTSTYKFYDKNVSPLPSVKFKPGTIKGVAKKIIRFYW